MSEKRGSCQYVGIGILISSVIGIATNVAIPYAYGDFRFINIGSLASIVTLIAIVYAVATEGLFNIRIVIRTAFIYAVMVGVILEFYTLLVATLTALIPVSDPHERQLAAAAVAFIVNAFTYQPIRDWLEKLARQLTGREANK